MTSLERKSLATFFVRLQAYTACFYRLIQQVRLQAHTES